VNLNAFTATLTKLFTTDLVGCRQTKTFVVEGLLDGRRFIYFGRRSLLRISCWMFVVWSM